MLTPACAIRRVILPSWPGSAWFSRWTSTSRTATTRMLAVSRALRAATAIVKEEMGDALAVDYECASALNAHAGATQSVAHLRQRAGTVFQRNRYILHVVSSIARNTRPQLRCTIKTHDLRA